MKETIVYWSPLFSYCPPGEDWSMLYPTPRSLFDEMRNNMGPAHNQGMWLYCPAVSNFARNTFVIRNPMEANLKVTNDKVFSKNESWVGGLVKHPSTIKNSLTFEYNLHWIFFSEDDINVSLTSPYYDVPQHLQSGHLVPGQFNISKWFRAINLEFNLKSGVDEIVIDKDEPLAYINFSSEKPVKLKRFTMNDKLLGYARSCSNSSGWERWVPLLARYRRFQEAKMNKLILKEISKELIDD